MTFTFGPLRPSLGGGPAYDDTELRDGLESAQYQLRNLQDGQFYFWTAPADGFTADINSYAAFSIGPSYVRLDNDDQAYGPGDGAQWLDKIAYAAATQAGALVSYVYDAATNTYAVWFPHALQLAEGGNALNAGWPGAVEGEAPVSGWTTFTATFTNWSLIVGAGSKLDLVLSPPVLGNDGNEDTSGYTHALEPYVFTDQTAEITNNDMLELYVVPWLTAAGITVNRTAPAFGEEGTVTLTFPNPVPTCRFLYLNDDFTVENFTPVS